ncbi:hypothetical protein [Hyphobacterium marinum]|uniref:Uncharacterized protein n=1 Tax=Hyphobacterium marinum TaxID=3116574 RepID=A0ABU7LVX1_9PROT|nr:hypothetical protein [Hyphobacterium sp. Y6023]MEE2565709.1 hypothetical protein [Hyphobacterium sp. Y6023]
MAQRETGDAATETDPEASPGDGEEIVCYNRRRTGSHVRRRVCMTRNVSERAEVAAERALERGVRGQAYTAPEE